MLIKVEGQKKLIELPHEATGLDLAKTLHLNDPHQALALIRQGKTLDLSTPLRDGDAVTFLTFDSAAGKEVFWHTSAHVLAQAILRLWPEAKPTIGPPIDQGFYYDFANLNISDADFPKIEEEIEKILKENFSPQREVLPSKEQALSVFSKNPYKKELIADLQGEITAYRQGEFFDLCRGPHLPNLGKIKAFKILKTAGAYWRGDSTKEMLTRLYAISFPDRKELKAYLVQLEEAKKRDHKVLGPKLDLFSLKEESPGIPFIHPRGMIIWNRLLDFWREKHAAAGYVEIKTPQLMTKELWVTSGHWAYYRQNMFTSLIEEREFAIKPMNCPGCLLYYKAQTHSYRELPLRIAEIGTVHRYEPSGAISGLMRVRAFHQDDAHIFMQMSDIQPEIVRVLKLFEEVYEVFGLEYHLELSTRPEKGTIGTDADWEATTEALRLALEEFGRPFRINEGDGAFYGPKIDFHIKDAIGRTWQCGTIQLDMSLPEKFDIEYIADDGTRKRPVMIHRALFGSIERFLGILIEHFAGRFPLWLSPVQIAVLTVADRHAAYAHQVATFFRNSGFLCEVFDAADSVNKKVRNAQMNQFNYMLTVGDKEMENGTVGLRTRDNVVHGEIALQAFLEKISKELQSKSLTSSFS